MTALASPITKEFARKALITCEYSDRFYVDNEYDAESYLLHLSGPVLAFCDEVHGDDIEVGRWGVFYADVMRANEARISTFELMDMHHETCACFEALFDLRTHHFNSAVLAAVEAPGSFAGNVLLIDELSLDPAFRGTKPRLAIIRTLIRRFAHDLDIVAVDDRVVGIETALRAGFKPIDDTDFMIQFRLPA